MSVRRSLVVLSPLLLAAAAHAQLPGVVDYTPVPPPTAPWPMLANTAAWVGGPGTAFADVGTGRGQALVDVVGPDPTDPTNPAKVGPPDGILDLIQTNSNSPGLPMGVPPPLFVVPPIGTVHSKCIVYRGDTGGKWTDVTDVMSPYDPQGFNIAYPGGSPWGVITADYDDDGDWDLFYPCGGFNTNSPNSLMRNEGDGTFRNVSLAAGLLEDQDTFAAAWIDGDLDGDLDIYVANSVGIIPSFYQGDPNPDPTDRLYDNLGNGTFVDMAPLAGCDLKSNGFSVTTGDLDQNGFTDVVISCFQHYNKVFYNNGDKSFAFMGPSTNPNIQVTLDDMDPDPVHPGSEEFLMFPTGMDLILPMRTRWSMPVEIADMNGDTWLDILYVNWSFQAPDDNPLSAEGAIFSPADYASLYLNLGDQDGDGIGDGIYREVANEVGLLHVGGAMGLVVSDYNGDGWLDAYVGAGGPYVAQHYEEDYLYINEPTAWPDDFQQNPQQPLDRAFYEVGALSGTYVNNYMSHGLTATKVNGRIDVIVGNGGPAMLDSGQANYYWQNQGNSDGSQYRIVEVHLKEKDAQRAAIGARVELIRAGPGGAGQVLVQERGAGARFASQNAGPLLFGTSDDDLLFANVRWPSGTRQGTRLWGLPPPFELTFEEIDLSVGLDASYPSGGGLALQATVESVGTSTYSGDVLYGLLTPQPGGGFLPAQIGVLATGVTLPPGQPFVVSGTVDPAPTALYGLFFVDGTTAQIVNGSAIWHDPGLEDTGSAPLEQDPPDVGQTVAWIGRKGAVPPAGNTVPVERSLKVRTGKIEVARARVPLEFRSIDTSGRGELELGGGDVLRWNDGLVRFRRYGAYGAALTFDGERAMLATSVVNGCCEVKDLPLGTMIRFEADERIEADAFRLEPDGRLVLE